MRQVIGIGETIYDIIFRNGQPVKAVPGGSAFNAIISLGRAGVKPLFISETGDDIVGRIITGFMAENGVSAENVSIVGGTKSPVSLAFLNDKNDAEYVFHKNHEQDKLGFDFPEIKRDDIVLIGSYYSINPVIRQRFASFLEYCRQKEAIVYYDVNFRSSHQAERMKLMANILENFEYSSVVRGSSDDFGILFDDSNADTIFANHVRFYCPRFICTSGAGNIELRTRELSKSYVARPIETVSTIGAGDNFNAGFVFGMLREGVGTDELQQMTEAKWDRLIASGQAFASDVCQSLDNYISREFADSLR